MAAIVVTGSVAAQDRVLSVMARDSFGQPVMPTSVVIVDAANGTRLCSTVSGRSQCSIREGDVKLVVSASGFEDGSVPIPADEAERVEVEVQLRPAGIREQVVVSANRVETRLGDTPVSVSIIGRETLALAAAPTLDDALRQVPGFSIFRRSSSRNSNPTTQGVSLRGVGASGASRSLVLFDGVPLNDVFGGWVQWNRTAPIAVEQVEVVRGGASSLYGSGSLSGTIDIIPRSAAEPLSLAGDLFGGTQRTISASGFAGGKFGNWAGDIAVGQFKTSGFITVDEAERGEVDSAAGVSSTTASGRLGREFGAQLKLFVRPSYFTENRTNGTPLQTNQTHSRSLIVGGTWSRFSRPDLETSVFDLEWRLYGGSQVYDQTFSAVNAGRSSENLTRLQRSPAQYSGFSVQVGTVFRKNTIIGGFEGRSVRGSSDEVVFVNNTASTLVGSGGREHSFGVFVQDILALGERAVISGSVRFDRWSNERGLSVLRNLASGNIAVTEFPDRQESAFSPRLSALIRVNEAVSLHASASRNFRAPTLNELYRGFRVGNVVTVANAALQAERASSIEAGSSVVIRGIYLRATAFLTDVDRAVANVTIGSTPDLITRQRQNAGKTRAAGFEVDAEKRFADLAVNAGYMFADSRVTAFSANPQLVGREIPQVPRHQFTVQFRYAVKKWSMSVQGRAASQQFDDDLNLFRLEPYLQADLFVSRRIKKSISVYAAVENIFNSRYSVGRTPVRTISSPLNLRIGVRWK